MTNLTHSEKIARLSDLAWVKRDGQAYDMLNRIAPDGNPDDIDMELAMTVARAHELVKCWECLDRGCAECCSEEEFQA